MGVKQGPPSVAVQLRDLVWDMCRRTQSLPKAAERIALIRDVRDTPPRKVRGQGVGGSCVAIVADDERRGVRFQSLFGKTLPSSSQAVVVKEERRLPQNLQSCSRGRVPAGGGIHAMVTGIEVSSPVPKCYRMQEYDIYGVDTGADDHQPPDPFAGDGHGGHEAVHRALFLVGVAASHKMDRTAIGILMDYVG